MFDLNGIISNTVFTIAGAFIGTYLSYLREPDHLPVWITCLISSKKIDGEWYCLWKSDKMDTNFWVCDKVKIKQVFGKVLIDVIEPGDEFDWKAICSIDKDYLIGTWHSKNKGSHARGTIMLKISPQGNCLAGYAIGSAENDKIFPQNSVFARTKEDVLKKKKSFLKLL